MLFYAVLNYFGNNAGLKLKSFMTHYISIYIFYLSFAGCYKEKAMGLLLKTKSKAKNTLN